MVGTTKCVIPKLYQKMFYGWHLHGFEEMVRESFELSTCRNLRGDAIETPNLVS